ncbi:MAG TPA: hypothetical protein VGK32_06415 [Vicinamibacterales bacterium]|jgi:hypothetical protein
MTHPGKARTALKRGSLIAAANWQVVVIQSVAETTFKLLVALPVVGGVILVTVLLGRDISDILTGDLREISFGVMGTLLARPVALGFYLFGFLLVLAGGSILMFLVKGGTVSVLVHADRVGGPIERPPLRYAAFRRAMQFTIEGFTAGAGRLFRRYLALGLLLGGIYLLAGTLCVLLAYGLYRLGGAQPLLLGSVVALAISLFVALITMINVLYLLAQMVVAVTDGGVGRAAREVGRFLRGEFWKLTRVFGVTVLLLVVATGLSIAATWGFYLIAYVPLAGLIVLPLQLGAWLLRNLLFQYLGITALAAYLSLYRSFADDPAAGRGPRLPNERPHD